MEKNEDYLDVNPIHNVSIISISDDDNDDDGGDDDDNDDGDY
jgi:hypothetical protein